VAGVKYETGVGHGCSVAMVGVGHGTGGGPVQAIRNWTGIAGKRPFVRKAHVVRKRFSSANPSMPSIH
jgi:hypothetical protein